MPIPLVGKFFHSRHDTEVFFPQDAPHTLYFEENADLYLGQSPESWSWRVPGDTVLTVVTFEGPSIIHFDLKTPLGRLRLIKTVTPVEPFRVHCIDEWYSEKNVPLWYVKLVAKIAAGALLQDKDVWENKTFNTKPLLVRGDGPFPHYRRWFRQFYSEHSEDLAKKYDDW
eukprot:Sdes_comp19932_c0_seq1m12399